MQTFLPYKSFTKSAKCLDYRRLGKQRVEAYQILLVLLGKSKGNGWKNHPAVKMWRGHESALVSYALTMCEEWISRGYKDTLTDKINALLPLEEDVELPLMPRWLGNKEFHDSHKSNLIRKFPEHYQPMWPEMDGSLPYVWPVNKEK